MRTSKMSFGFVEGLRIRYVTGTDEVDWIIDPVVIFGLLSETLSSISAVIPTVSMYGVRVNNAGLLCWVPKGRVNDT
jgi:hypothetical protein